MSTPKRPDPSARGYRIRELAAREQVTTRTAWRWVEKGVLEVSRLGPRTGVRVQYVDPADTDRKRQ
jgi:transposase